MRKRNIAFLNQAGNGREATIGWDVRGSYGSGFIVISDCSRKVSLDLDVSGKSAYENSLHKIDRLLKELTDCRQALRAEREAYLASGKKDRD